MFEIGGRMSFEFEIYLRTHDETELFNLLRSPAVFRLPDFGTTPEMSLLFIIEGKSKMAVIDWSTWFCYEVYGDIRFSNLIGRLRKPEGPAGMYLRIAEDAGRGASGSQNASKYAF